MANEIGAGLSLKGMVHEDSQYPFYISGTVVKGDEGKAVTIDTTAAMTVKLAGDGDPIIGRLEVFEDRVQEGVKIATVAYSGPVEVPTTGTVNVGDTLQGSSTAGVAKALAPTLESANAGQAVKLTTHNNRNLVWATRTGFATIIL